MRKARSAEESFENRDTLRPEYDFTGAVRGVTAAQYARGTNIVAVDPELRDVFPDSNAVNEALRALAPLLREQRRVRRRRSAPPRPRGHSAKRATRTGRGG